MKQRERRATMTEDTLCVFDLPVVQGKKVTADFESWSIPLDVRPIGQHHSTGLALR